MVTMAQSANGWNNFKAPHGCALNKSHAFTHTLTSTQFQPRGAERQLSYFSACWVFSCFRNPPNSDMGYRIFNVRICCAAVPRKMDRIANWCFTPSQPWRVIIIRAKQIVFLPQEKIPIHYNTNSTVEDWINLGENESIGKAETK